MTMLSDSILDQRFTVRDLLDPASLTEVCQAFSICFGFGIIVLDEDGQELLHVGSIWPFCESIRDHAESRERCVEVSLRIAKHELVGSNVAQVKSFCGFKYAMFPLNYQFDNLGRVVVGPYADQITPAEQIKTLAEKYHFDPQETLKKAQQIPVIDTQRLKDIIRLLAKILDSFLFVNAKRLITTRMHLENIFDSRESIFKKMERETSGTAEDRAEIEKLKSMF